MESDAVSYIRIILRWSWVTLILVAATAGVIIYSNADVPLVYWSTVKLQVAAPEPEEVALFTTVRAGSTRDEISAVQTTFAQIAKGTAVTRMTIQALGLKISPVELQDRISIEIPPYSDFVNVSISADNPDDAANLARVQTNNALSFYGEARAKTATERKVFITQQLQTASADLTTAREALLRFQVKYGTADLARDIQQYQDTLRSLRLDRDRNMIEIERSTAAVAFYTASAQKAAAENDPGAVASYRNSATANQGAIEGLKAAIARQNEIIAQREIELVALVSLTSQYDGLRTDLQRAENNYNFLQGKLNEATIKENDARSVGHIQIVEPAQTPTRGQRTETKNLLIPGVAASVIGGVILSFVLEFIFGAARRRRRQSARET